MSSAMTTAGTAAATIPASEACATDWPRADIALACALGLALLGWIDSFLWAHAFGPWWNLIGRRVLDLVRGRPAGELLALAGLSWELTPPGFSGSRVRVRARP